MTDDDWSGAAAIAAAVLRSRDGVAPLRAFLDAGLTALQVAGLRRRGFLERPRKGWYVDPGLPWEAKHAVRVGGVVTCVSACDAFGLPIPPDARRCVHVLLPGNAPRVRHHRDARHLVVPGEDREVVRHWSRSDGTRPGWRDTLVGSLAELAGCVPHDWWVAALDAALHRPRDGEPILSAAEFARLEDLLPARLRPALALVDPLAGSCIETLLRLGIQRRGIGPVVSQFEPPGTAWAVDFRIGARLLVEADGEAYHDPEKDAVRDAVLRSLGWEVFRCTYREIVDDLEGVLDRLEATLRALGAASSVV